MSESLGTALPKEIVRNEQLLIQYAGLPDNAGWFASTMIQQDLVDAQLAMASDDVIEMLKAYEKLKGNE